MPFLHFEAHRCCMDILFYNFCTDFIEISWYCKFAMVGSWAKVAKGSPYPLVCKAKCCFVIHVQDWKSLCKLPSQTFWVIHGFWHFDKDPTKMFLMVDNLQLHIVTFQLVGEIINCTCTLWFLDVDMTVVNCTIN
jgi:hypothetical protein